MLKRENFFNWPTDVRLGRIIKQGKQSLVKLYSNLHRIDFTKEFLDRYASKPKDGTKDKLIQEIKEKLLEKLRAGLEREGIDVRINSVPWFILKRDDLINWPVSVPVQIIFKQYQNSIRKIHYNLGRINFTLDFLKKLEAGNSVH